RRLLKRERPIGYLNKFRRGTTRIGREVLEPEQPTTFRRANIREGTPSDEFRLPSPPEKSLYKRTAKTHIRPDSRDLLNRRTKLIKHLSPTLNYIGPKASGRSYLFIHFVDLIPFFITDYNTSEFCGFVGFTCMTTGACWQDPIGLQTICTIVKKIIPTWTDGLHPVQLKLISVILDGQDILCCTATGDENQQPSQFPALFSSNTMHIWMHTLPDFLPEKDLLAL
ncbi:uncharacterized protein LACBIDRAFT_334843, partial [Laccaria bicolor S238N-H82]